MTVNFGSRKTDCNNEVTILTGLSQGWVPPYREFYFATCRTWLSMSCFALESDMKQSQQNLSKSDTQRHMYLVSFLLPGF